MTCVFKIFHQREKPNIVCFANIVLIPWHSVHAEMFNMNEQCILDLNHVCDLDALCPLRKGTGVNHILIYTSVCVFKRFITFNVY